MSQDAILRFLQHAGEDEKLWSEMIQLAAKYGYNLTDAELSEEQLDSVAGGAAVLGTAEKEAEIAAQVADEFKAGADSAKEMWKMSLQTLREHQERQQQNVQSITRI